MMDKVYGRCLPASFSGVRLLCTMRCCEDRCMAVACLLSFRIRCCGDTAVETGCCRDADVETGVRPLPACFVFWDALLWRCCCGDRCTAVACLLSFWDALLWRRCCGDRCTAVACLLSFWDAPLWGRCCGDRCTAVACLLSFWDALLWRRCCGDRCTAVACLLSFWDTLGDDTALQIDLEGNVRHHLQLEDH